MTLGAIMVASMIAMVEGNEKELERLSKLHNEEVARIKKEKRKEMDK